MGIRTSIKKFLKVNWVKTLYFNYTKFPLVIAKQLPVYFYGKVKFNSIKGSIIINAPIKRAMIGFGQEYEQNTVHIGIAEIVLHGTMVFNGNAQFAKDYFIFVGKGAHAEFGHMAAMASRGKIICTNKIKFGDYARSGSECQFMDTDFHQMIDTNTGEHLPMNGTIELGNYNYICTAVSVMKNTKTADYCTVASNSVCNKDYSFLGQNILIGGMPAKLLKQNISRDWQGEQELLEKWMCVK